jgi:hypothetical protein
MALLPPVYGPGYLQQSVNWYSSGEIDVYKNYSRLDVTKQITLWYRVFLRKPIDSSAILDLSTRCR